MVLRPGLACDGPDCYSIWAHRGRARRVFRADATDWLRSNGCIRPSGRPEGLVCPHCFHIALVKSRAEVLDHQREDSRAAFVRLSLLTPGFILGRRFRIGIFAAAAGPFLPHRFALQFDAVSRMHQPVEDAVGNRGISDLPMPLRHR